MDLDQAGFFLTPLLVSFGLSSTVASIVSGFVLAAGALLLAFLLAPKIPKPDDGKFVIQQSIPPRAYGYGTAMISGSYMLKISPSNGGIIFQVNALVSHRVADFVQLYLHDDQVTIDTTLGPQTHGGAVNPEADGRYGWDDSNPRVWVDWRFGADAETPYWFTSNATVAAFFGPAAVGNGIASAAYEFRDSNPEKQVMRYPNGAPEPHWLLDLALVFDPRDPAQDRNDPDTWVFKRNPVLGIIHYICFSEFGYRRPYSQAILPLEDEWKAEADICDEDQAVFGGGTQKRYELGGWATTENEQKTVLVQMLAACDGWLVERGDKAFVLRVGKFRPSGVTIEAEDITGFEYQRGLPDEEVINRLDVSFTSPAHLYVEAPAKAWEDLADQAARGKVRQNTYELTWVQDWRRARRLAKREFKRLREPLRGALDLRFSGLNAAYERWIYIGDVPIPGFSNRYVENRGASYSLSQGGLRLQVIGADASIDDWTATLADEGPAPPVIPDAVNDLIGQPANVTAFLEDFLVGQPPTTAQRIVIDFDKPDPFVDRDYASRWRVVDTDPGTPGDQPGAWVEQLHRQSPLEPSATRFRLKTSAVESDQLLEVSICSVSSKGTFNDFTAPVPVYSGPVPPDVLTDQFSVALTDASGTVLTT